jgi:hypothetical protein
MTNCSTSGKRKYPTYRDALVAFDRLVREGALSADGGSIYECLTCGAWHISSRRFTLTKAKGRGKTRKGIVYKNKNRGAA